MVSYPYAPFDSAGQSSRKIIFITEDDNNNLWLIGDENLNKYDLEKEVFTSIHLFYDGFELNLNNIKYDPGGFLWLGSSVGMFRYYPDQDSLSRVPLFTADGKEITEYPEGLPWKSLEHDSTGLFWMIDYQLGLFFLDPNKDEFRQLHLDLPDFLSGDIHPTDIKRDAKGDFWILGNRAELALFNPYTRTFEWADLSRYDHMSPTIRGGLTIDHEGKIWFGIDRGLMQYDPALNTVYAMDPPENPSLVMDLITDTHGNVIVATMSGVKLVDNQASKVQIIPFSEYILEEGINWFTGLVREGQTFWISTLNRGLIRYNAENGKSRYYHDDGKPGSLALEWLDNVLRDRDGRIWVITIWGHLQRYDPEKDSFETFKKHSNQNILMDKDGLFWLLDQERMLSFDPVTFDTVSYRFKEPLPLEELLSLMDWEAFALDNEGIFWFGQMDGGLYRIDLESRDWSHYSYDPDRKDGLPDKFVRRIFCDSKGRVWLSTWPGLSRIIKNPENGPYISFDNTYITEQKVGKTYSITEDKDQNIWIGTGLGAYVIRSDETIEFYSSDNGLPERPSIIKFNSCDPETGEMYLGSADLAILPPDFLQSNSHIPPVNLTDFSIAGERIAPGEDSPLDKAMLFTDRLELHHDQNFFRIDFAAINFAHPEQNQYKYFLDGIDHDTIYAGNNSYAEYTDLAPGNYTFWVSGSNNSGIWNPEGRSIEIVIHPPWYRSKAATSGYLLAMLLLVMGYVRLRTERLRKEKVNLETQVAERTVEITQKNEKIMEMERLKTRFFTDISHEIRTPLSLISGPIDALMDQEHTDPKTESRLSMIKRNSQRLLQLVNQLLDISRLDSGQMKLVLENSDVIRHIRVIANEYISLAEKKHICYILDFPEEELILWNDRDKISKIVTNLLSNAFKFTPEFGTITCRAKIQSRLNASGSKQLRIIMADTGQGIPVENQEKIFDRFFRSEEEQYDDMGGTGIGLSLTKELVKMLHGEIKLRSIVGTGTVFMVTLPLGIEHLKENEYILKEQKKHTHQETVNETQVREKTDSDSSNYKDLTILLVEDNDEVRTFLKENLEPTYKILEAADGIEGLNLATKSLPDVIISDIMMPGMDGKELCKKLKNNERTCHIPIILLTARATSNDKIEGLECGADAYIFKPFNMLEIEVRIRKIMEQRDRLRKKYSAYIGLDWSEITVTTLDEQFLKKVTNTIGEHLHDFKFDVGDLQNKLALSGSTLSRKLKALTGETPNSLIRIMRLKKAASLIENGNNSITDILMEVGFSNPSYFARCFKAYFGVTPKAYQKSFNGSRIDL